VIAYLAISLVFFWPILQGITTVVPGSGGDVFQSMWDLWWTPYSLFTLGSSPYYTQYVYWPVGSNLATQTLAPIAGLVSVAFQAVSLAFAYNVIFLLGFVLAGLFTYMLATISQSTGQLPLLRASSTLSARYTRYRRSGTCSSQT